MPRKEKARMFPGNKSCRKPTPGGLHALSSSSFFNSSRTQKIIGLSSCVAGWRAIVLQRQMESAFAQLLNLLLG